MDLEKGKLTSDAKVSKYAASRHYLGHRVARLITVCIVVLILHTIMSVRHVSPIAPALFRDNAMSVTLGFALTPTYGIVALRVGDELRGSAKVDGSEDYINMMRRLSLPSSKHAA